MKTKIIILESHAVTGAWFRAFAVERSKDVFAC